MPEIKTNIREDGVAIVTIHHPERRNACTQDMWEALGKVFTELPQNPQTRAIVLTGTGEHFCAGADISEFSKARNDAKAAANYSRHVDNAETAIHHAPMPVIAAIRGSAIGGGCGLAVACDFRIGDEKTRMGIPAARLSVVYSLKETQVLSEVVGAKNAKRILFSGDYFDAEGSVRLGLLDEIVDDPLQSAIDYASHIAERAPMSVKGAKLAINAIASGAMENVHDEYELLRDRAADSLDYAEGQRAFLEKRKPRFQGR